MIDEATIEAIRARHDAMFGRIKDRYLGIGGGSVEATDVGWLIDERDRLTAALDEKDTRIAELEAKLELLGEDAEPAVMPATDNDFVL